MAWNGSEINTPPSAQKPARAPVKGASKWPLVLVALLAIAAAAAAIWFFTRSDGAADRRVRRETRPAVIAEVKPAVTNAPPKPAPAAKPKKPELPPLKPGERRRVHWVRPPNWDQMSPAEKTRCQPVARVIKPVGWDDRNRLFTEPSDKAFARLLGVRPGQMLLGSGNYGARFMQGFLDSLKTPIVINDDDSPEDKAMKQAVIDCRNDLKAAWDRGEDIGQIMRDAEREIRDQATYRCDLRRELAQIRREGKASEEEYRDFCAAADKMLESKGLEPLKMGRFSYRKAQYDNAVEADKGE